MDGDETAAGSSRRLQLGFLLIGSGLVGVVAGMPLQAAILRSLPVELPVPTLAVLVAQAVQLVVLMALSVWCGLTLGARVGLGAPVVNALLDADWRSARRRVLQPALGPAAVIGIGGAFTVVGLDLVAFRGIVATIDAPDVALWQALPAVLYGGIVEELLARFGVLSLVAWTGARLTRDTGVPPGAAVRWLAIVVAALAFGALHLPYTAALVELSGTVVARALLLNGLLGLGFGWLFWRHCLEAAIVAHVLANLVLIPIGYIG